MAPTIPDIIRIVPLKEKGTTGVELKTFRKPLSFDKEQKREIVYEIIAFANRQGGKIIFGINDDGHPDEKQAMNIDEIK